MNIYCHNLALSDKPEDELKLFISSVHFGIHSIKPWHKTHDSMIVVRCTTLEEFLRNYGIELVSLLKVDTEGNDFNVI